MNGFPIDGPVVAYLAAWQSSAVQIEALLDAINAIASDERRRPLLLQMVADASEIAAELNHALDAVTAARELGGA